VIGNYKEFTKTKFYQYLLLFLTLYSFDVIINLIILEQYRKDLFLIGYILYAVIILPLAVLIFKLLKKVSRFSPTDDSSFFGFWALLLPLMQIFPTFRMHLPDRFVSMSLVLALIFSVIAALGWGFYSKKTKIWQRGPLFLWFQLMLLAGIQFYFYINHKYIYNSFTLRGMLIYSSLFFVLLILLVIFKVLYTKLSDAFNSKTFYYVLILFNVTVLIIVLITPVITWHQNPNKDINNPSSISSSSSRKPNILLITLDGVRNDRIELYGYERETMPNLTSWAQKATIFTNGYSNSSWFLPSLASVFTGLRPSRHGVQNLLKNEHFDPVEPIPICDTVSHLKDNIEPLPEILQKYEYLTCAISAEFELMVCNPEITDSFRYYRFDGNGTPQLLPYRILQPANIFFETLVKLYKPYRSAEYITDDAIEWIEKHSNETFILMINYMDANLPCDPIPYYKDLFYDKEIVDKSKYSKQVKQGMYYDAELRYLDDEIKRLLDKLDDYSWYDSTMIIITSMHGESIGDWGMYGHGFTLDEREIKIPLIIKYPYQNEGEVDNQFVQTADLFPTILKAATGSYPADIDGIPLDQKEGHLVIAELKPSPFIILEYGNKYDRKIKAIILQNGLKLLIPTDGPPRMFNLLTDPHEKNNIASQNTAMIKEIRRKYFSN
jgi:arylsulfatase A-like enzyme